MPLRTSASWLSHVGPAACRCGPISRPGHAAISPSHALSDVRGPRYSSKGSYSGTRFLQTAPGQLLCNSVPTQNMGLNALRQLSPSGDQEAPWAQPKSGTKWADGSSTSRSPSGDGFLSSKDGRSRRQDSSPSSSPDRLSPPSKQLRAVSRNLGCRSCSHDALVPGAIALHHSLLPVVVAVPLPLLPVLVAVPLPHLVGPEHVPPSLVGRHHPALLGDPPETCLCHLDAVHPPPQRGDHPGAVIHPLAPGGCPLIAAATPPAPGPLLLVLVGDPGHALTAHTHGLSPRIVFHLLMRWINAF